jgi:hypothetical protein
MKKKLKKAYRTDNRPMSDSMMNALKDIRERRNERAPRRTEQTVITTRKRAAAPRETKTTLQKAAEDYWLTPYNGGRPVTPHDAEIAFYNESSSGSEAARKRMLERHGLIRDDTSADEARERMIDKRKRRQ